MAICKMVSHIKNAVDIRMDFLFSENQTCPAKRIKSIKKPCESRTEISSLMNVLAPAEPGQLAR